MRPRSRATLLGTALAGACLLSAVSASAAYVPGPFSGAAPANSFTTILVCQTVPGTGGIVTAVDGPVTVTVTVPSGALPDGTQVCIYKGDRNKLQPLLPGADTLVDAYAVGWQPVVTAAKPLIETISDPAIQGGDAVFQTTGGGLVPFTGGVTPGGFHVTFTEDPGYVLAQATVIPSGVGNAGGGAGATRTSPAPLVGVALLALLGLIATMTWRSTRRRGQDRP